MLKRRSYVFTAIVAALLFLVAIIAAAGAYFFFFGASTSPGRPLTQVRTIAGLNEEFGETYGIAVRGGEIFVSDGEGGKIWKLAEGIPPVEYAAGLNTPSAIAFDAEGALIVADTGSHTIKKIVSGKVTLVAGAENEPGIADGPALSAQFNGPVGVAVAADGAIIVADTYNDRIRTIRDGSVTTLAGSGRGFADGVGTAARFDTPCGVLARKDGSLLIADTLNGRIRIVDADGNVGTLAGNGDPEQRDGTLAAAAFYRPYTITDGPDGSLFVGDGNAVRVIRNRVLPFVETLSQRRRGFADGPPVAASFNRVSGISVDERYRIYIADSGNAAVRSIRTGDGPDTVNSSYVSHAKRTDPAEFRSRQPGRWPYDPPDARRDIAGTLGEIRGEIVDEDSQAWFHNGLDIAGGYGEKARFIRDEKVLDPSAVENYDTLRELLRLPTVGYIHIRLGRDAAEKSLGDTRFQFDPGMTGVRVRRGTTFRAGEIIGTLNAMNHVHLIAGPGGDEMNALDALILPGAEDKTAPIIEETAFFSENWDAVETKTPRGRIILSGKTRIVARAYDRMDGNPERRRLGVHRVGYQLLNRDLSPVTGVNWNINFDRNPPPEAVRFAYARGSRSGATGETIFRYIVTNNVDGGSFGEGFLETADVPAGEYILRVLAADHFGNTTMKDIEIEVANEK